MLFTVKGELKASDARHCLICRKNSGHYYSGADIARDRVCIEGGENVTCYRSSETVRPAFFDPIYRAGSAGVFEANQACDPYFRGGQGRLLRDR